PLYASAQRRPRGTLEVRSLPSGAALSVDERLRGPTPQQLTLWAGAHQLLLRQPGLPDVRRTVEISAGKTQRLDVSLTPDGPEPRPTAPPPPPPEWRRAPRPRWRLVTGGIILGAGLVTLGALAIGAGVYQSAQPTDVVISLKPSSAALLGVG